jgi:predicted amidohydrolase
VRRAVAVTVALLLLLAGTAHADRRVRLVAVQPKISMDWLVSRDTYQAKLFGLRFAATQRTLATYPEDLGLLAAFTGTRGAPARSAPSLIAAIASLITTYAPLVAHYSARFPELADRGIPTRALGLALTDTFGRVAVETGAELAQRTHAYVVFGVTMPETWRVVCATAQTQPPPGAEGCDAVDPALVALLRNPDEPMRAFAYEATSSKVQNVALVFDPEGRLIGRQAKRYLVPDELPGALDLAPAPAVAPIRTPLGRIGIVTSKDAWMPDVTDTLDAAGTDILVQPEFFVGDTLSATGPWAPDTIAAAGYSDLLRGPSVQAMVLPSMTGTLLDYRADNQSAIAVEPTPDGPRGHLAGQLDVPGYAAVAPPAAEDPEGEPVAVRRQALAAAGGAQEAVISHDVVIRSRRGEQRNVTVAGRLTAFEQGGHVHVNGTDLGSGRWPELAGRWLTFERAGRVLVTHREAGNWTPPVPVPGTAAQRRPTITALADGAYVTWIDDRTVFEDDGLARSDVYGARVSGDTMGPAVRIDSAGPTDPLAAKLDNDWAPAVAARGDHVVVAWVDFGNYEWNTVAATSRDGGRTFSPPERLNAPSGEALNDDPDVAFAAGEPLVAWTDYGKPDSPRPAPLYDIAVGAPGRPPAPVDGRRGSVSAFAPALLPPFVVWEDHARGVPEIFLRRLPDGRTRRLGRGWRPAITRTRGRVRVAWEESRTRRVRSRRLP